MDAWERQSDAGATATCCLGSYFGTVPDQRAANAAHWLGDYIAMMIAARQCGAGNHLQFADTDNVPTSCRIEKCAWNDDCLINDLAHLR